MRLNVFKLLFLLILSGCVIIPVKYKWIPPNNIPQIQIHFFETQKEVTEYCESLGVIASLPFKVLACNNKTLEKCDIYIYKNYEEYMMTHELLHCSGWRHENIK